MVSISRTEVRANRPQSTSAWNLGALDYLQQCLDRKRSVACITGARGSGKAMLLRRFLQYRTTGPVAFAKSSTDSPSAFLESILLQFGLEALESSLSELSSLATVYIKHQASKGSRPIIVIENAQDYGPTVLELIQTFSALEIEGEPAILLILTGTRAVNDRLENPIAADACDLDALNAIPMIANKEVDRAYGHLEVRLGDNFVAEHIIDRRQVLIGRKQHNDICLTGRFVSRHHAVLISQPTGVYIVDLKSTNGLSVNGEPVRRQALSNGDVIGISNYRLKFVDIALEHAAPDQDGGGDPLSQTIAMRRHVGTTIPNMG